MTSCHLAMCRPTFRPLLASAVPAAVVEAGSTVVEVGRTAGVRGRDGSHGAGDRPPTCV